MGVSNADGASSQRRLCVAIDHGLGLANIPPLDSPREMLNAVVSGQPDFLILTPGLARMLPDKNPSVEWYMTADYFVTSSWPGQSGFDTMHGQLFTAEHAKAAGATGVKVLLVFGRNPVSEHLKNFQFVSRLIEEASRCNLKVMVETVLWGEQIANDKKNDGELVAHAAHVGFELGADIIKVPIPESAETLCALARTLPVPVYLMGGPSGDPKRLFERVRRCIDGGVYGVAFGRNVWMHPDPPRYMRALRALCYDGVDVDEAVSMIDAVE